MGLYDRDYARGNAYGYETSARSESQIISFVKETYKLFAASMIAGAVGAYAGMPFASVVAANYWFIAIPWLLFGIFGFQMVKNKPGINIVALFIFTFVSGVIITPLLTHILSMSGGASIIGNAFAMTSVVFGAMSFYAIKTTKDFTGYGKPLMIAVFVILGFIVLNLIIGNPLLHVLISGAIVLLASFMVVYDTQNIMAGNYETPIEGAIALYIDFFNIFVNLLQLFGIFGNDD